jgi:uncharacterized membrane-anchored protein YhcB (DUF1043 family)
MAPYNRLSSNSEKLQQHGGKADTIVQTVKKDYEKLADQADRLLQEKQALDWLGKALEADGVR